MSSLYLAVKGICDIRQILKSPGLTEISFNSTVLLFFSEINYEKAHIKIILVMLLNALNVMHLH